MSEAPKRTHLVRVLASGSSGNAVFLRSGETRLLFDAGISRRRIVHALRDIDEDLDDLSAILVTHEHRDHVHALPMIERYHPEIPVWATAGTWAGCRRQGMLPRSGCKQVVPGASFLVGDVQVSPFAIQHDARDPVGYRVDADGFSLCLATDLGRGGPEVESALTGCQVIVLEANHDEKMLWAGPYPRRLKRRVASPLGHLSNLQTLRLLSRVGGPHLDTVILGHLSEANNKPSIALNTVLPALEGLEDVKILAADRMVPGDPMEFVGRAETAKCPSVLTPTQSRLPFVLNEPEPAPSPTPRRPRKRSKSPVAADHQITLF